MYYDVMEICSTGIGAVMGWFNRLIPEDFKTLILGMFAMFVVYNLLVRPLIGGAGSDSIVRNRKAAERESQNLANQQSYWLMKGGGR